MTEKRKRIIFQISFLLVALLLMEIILRFMGYQPGDLRPKWLYFTPVDSLYQTHNYYVNDKGLLVADSNFWKERGAHINKEGFRGPELDALDTAKKKIMMIGDSFTWGLNADPFYDSSFSDILGRETNYEVLNFGIPATDPVQYNKIAEVYIPQLKPTNVFVFVFTGNDIMQRDRTIKPKVQSYFWTNAGAIEADMNGRHFETAQAAYDYLVNERYYLKNPKRWYEKIIAQSALLSRLYSFKYRVEEKIDFERARRDVSITKKYLKNIISVAETNGALVRLVLIPELKDAGKEREKYIEGYSVLLRDSDLADYWLIPEVQKADYKNYPDAHLNNAGHRKYADYLEKFLQSQPKP